MSPSLRLQNSLRFAWLNSVVCHIRPSKGTLHPKSCRLDGDVKLDHYRWHRLTKTLHRLPRALAKPDHHVKHRCDPLLLLRQGERQSARQMESAPTHALGDR
jgi:hypothetical protein